MSEAISVEVGFAKPFVTKVSISEHRKENASQEELTAYALDVARERFVDVLRDGDWECLVEPAPVAKIAENPKMSDHLDQSGKPEVHFDCLQQMSRVLNLSQDMEDIIKTGGIGNLEKIERLLKKAQEIQTIAAKYLPG